MTKVIVLSVVLSLLVFGSGIFLGYGFQKRTLTQSNAQLDEIRKEINQMQTMILFSTLGKNFTCSYYEFMLQKIGDRLEAVTEQVISMEKDVHLTSKESRESTIAELMNLRLQYWVLAENYRRQCDPDYHTILYFYRVKPTCYECEVEGQVLAELSQKCDVAVAPISLNVDLDTISLLTQVYNVSLEDAPVLIIDGNQKLQGLVTLDELNETIC